MTLYITHALYLKMIEQEIETVLKNGDQILLYYDEKTHVLSDTIMDHIAEGNIKIKRLTEPVSQAFISISYEIGRLHKEDIEKRICLWGGTNFQEIADSVLKYERDAHFLKIKRIDEKKEMPVKENKKKSRDTHAVKKNTSSVGETKQFKATKSSSELSVSKEKKNLRIPDIFSAFDEMDDPVSPEMEVAEKDTNADTKKAEQTTFLYHETLKESKESVEGMVIDSFHGLLNDICKEVVNKSFADSVLLAALEVASFSSIPLAQEAYHQNLENYLGKRKADYFYKKTMQRFEEILSFVKTKQ